MKVLLTGGSGFIGRAVIKSLEKTSHEVLSFSRSEEALSPGSNIQWVKVNLSDPQTYRSVIDAFQPEMLIHLAWQDIPDFSLQKSQVNLVQSQNLIEAVIGTPSCRKVVVSGSCFEAIKKGEVLESDIGAPKDSFTWAKHSLRTWLEMECNKKNINWGWFRIFYAYGPKQRSASLLPTLLRSLSTNTPPPISTPRNENDFIYIDDLAQAFTNAIEYDWHSGIFNLGSGAATSILEMCRKAEYCVNGTGVLTEQMIANAVVKSEPVAFWANSARAQKELQWSPVVTLEEGIRKTWESMSAHGTV
jgi:UDP-glucose 4-epimerase